MITVRRTRYNKFKSDWSPNFLNSFLSTKQTKDNQMEWSERIIIQLAMYNVSNTVKKVYLYYVFRLVALHCIVSQTGMNSEWRMYKKTLCVWQDKSRILIFDSTYIYPSIVYVESNVKEFVYKEWEFRSGFELRIEYHRLLQSSLLLSDKMRWKSESEKVNWAKRLDIGWQDGRWQ